MGVPRRLGVPLGPSWKVAEVCSWSVGDGAVSSLRPWHLGSLLQAPGHGGEGGFVSVNDAFCFGSAVMNYAPAICPFAADAGPRVFRDRWPASLASSVEVFSFACWLLALTSVFLPWWSSSLWLFAPCAGASLFLRLSACVWGNLGAVFGRFIPATATRCAQASLKLLDQVLGQALVSFARAGGIPQFRVLSVSLAGFGGRSWHGHPMRGQDLLFWPGKQAFTAIPLNGCCVKCLLGESICGTLSIFGLVSGQNGCFL